MTEQSVGSGGFKMTIGSSGRRPAVIAAAAAVGFEGSRFECRDRRPDTEVTSIEGQQLHGMVGTTLAAAPVIPLQRVNKWLANGSQEPAAGAEWQADERQPTTAAPELTLEEQAVREVLEDAARFKGEMTTAGRQPTAAIPLLLQNRVPGFDKAKSDEELYKLDVAMRPSESTLHDYERTPIDVFGEAMLRGMGWKEGEAIGGVNKGLAAPVMFVPRPMGLGLGANEQDAIKRKEDARKPQKYLKPGESREPEKAMVAPTGPDGRVRHVLGIDESLVAKEVLGTLAGNIFAFEWTTGSEWTLISDSPLLS